MRRVWLIYDRRALKRFLGPAILLLGLWACSSEEGVTPNVVTAGDGAPDAAVTTDASSNASMTDAAPPADQSMVTVSQDTGTAEAKPPGDAPMRDAPKMVDAGQIDASGACVKYCSCMAMNCAEKIFPTGCLVECAGQTNWDLPCRQNMCNLAPVQTMNDHCTHAFGVGQCTDN